MVFIQSDRFSNKNRHLISNCGKLPFLFLSAVKMSDQRTLLLRKMMSHAWLQIESEYTDWERQATVTFEDVAFCYSEGPSVFSFIVTWKCWPIFSCKYILLKFMGRNVPSDLNLSVAVADAGRLNILCAKFVHKYQQQV